ncbi:Cdc6/Cdc18 family protein [Halomarina ordinaria]|uniref:Cdc6/Cdc18 family protein n=1 Tax=Halomarina ordinaria TaxID=3033939 RepID=A0ABD5U5F3_9EURY|nr:ATP-binding protein [Halomarina sp. PSRA2]
MNFEERILRRQRTDGDVHLVRDEDALNPLVHPAEPVGRGPVLERLLDAVAPVFEDDLPTDTVLSGPAGSGKSAVVTALVGHLSRLLSSNGRAIYTTTRAGTTAPSFVFHYVDARTASSAFGLYYAALDGLTDEQPPRGGVRTDDLRDRLDAWLDEHDRRVLLVVDHVGEPETYPASVVRERFDALSGPVATLCVGREGPAADAPVQHVPVPAYDRHAVEDILTARAVEGLSPRAFTHDQLVRIATWAEGNAHDAVCALFCAVDAALEAGGERLTDAHVDAGIAAVPAGGIPLGRVLALTDASAVVLDRVVDLDDDQRTSVSATATAIAADPSVALSPGTVTRVLYELAESGVLDRVTVAARDAGRGRPPSRLDPRFSTLAYRHLREVGPSRQRD